MPEPMVFCHDIHGNVHETPVSKLHWRPTTYALVLHDGKMLLSKQHGTYVPPGGGVELGELPEQAAIRETKEETGIIVANPRLVSCHTSFFKLPHVGGEFVQSLVLFYQCEYVRGQFSIDELDEYEHNVSEMPEWVAIAHLDTIHAGSTVDWRSVVREILGQK